MVQFRERKPQKKEWTKAEEFMILDSPYSDQILATMIGISESTIQAKREEMKKEAASLLQAARFLKVI